MTVNAVPKVAADGEDFKRRAGVRQELQQLRPASPEHAPVAAAAAAAAEAPLGLEAAPEEGGALA